LNTESPAGEKIKRKSISWHAVVESIPTDKDVLMGKNQQGFSLIELLVAMALFATSLLFIFSVFPVSINSTFHGMNSMLASEIGQTEMEYLKTLSWDELDNGSSKVKKGNFEVKVTSNGVKTEYNFITEPHIQTMKNESELKIVRIDVKRVDGKYSRKFANFETIVFKDKE
jgi:prepilin-type N-terminal cleavage/methylation domain-containing protein